MSDMQSESSRVDQQLATIALEAGLSVAPYLKAVARSIPDFETKRDFHDPVTEHDRHVESQIRSFLATATPGCRFLGEEMGEDQGAGSASAFRQDKEGAADRLGSRLRWIIDPIDGTANFAAGLIYFCTSIAAELDGELVAGAITVPAVGEAFVADAQRAWHIDPDGTETPMDASGPHSERTALLASYYPGLPDFTSAPQRSLDHEIALSSTFGTVRRPGAGALDLAHVAAGWLGAAMGIRLKPWDVAAGIHMIRVAGGRVLNLPMGTDLPDGLRPGYVAESRNVDARTARKILEELNADFS